MKVVNKNPTIYLGAKEAELVAQELSDRDDDATVSSVIQECIRAELGDR